MDQRTFEFNNSRLTIRFGNILGSEADVIASSDVFFDLGGGAKIVVIRSINLYVLRIIYHYSYLQKLRGD